MNLLSPGDTPHENAQFLLFLAAVIQAVDDYQDLLRMSVATAGNDHRLGAHEAPPAVISIFLGDELTAILEAIEADAPYNASEKTLMKLGVHALPRFQRDTTDRNRTSPFAFTGNKFEFRMVGSSDSIACPNIMLNAAVADTLGLFADRLEGAADFSGELHALIRDTVRQHKRIIFNGNGYDDKWLQEAVEQRGLLNMPTTPDCVPTLLAEKNVAMLTRNRVFTRAELASRCEILLDNYGKTVSIEALTMVDMARQEILPAVEEYLSALAETARRKQAVAPELSCEYEKKTMARLTALTEGLDRAIEELERAMTELKEISGAGETALAIRDEILPRMAALRAVADEAETLTAEKYWPFPRYGRLLFEVG